MPDFDGKVALVTGAASGIGRETALAFARKGAKVVVSDVTVDAGEETVAMIKELGGDAIFVKADVADQDDVKALVDKTVETYGRLDFAHNNAGVEGKPGPCHECMEEDWDRVIAINLTGVFLCCKHEIAQMLEQGGGVIVNTASVAGLVGFPGIPPYVASKHGVVGLTKALALDYATQNIRINAVCPGVIHTAMVERFTGGDADALEEMGKSQPVERLGKPEEIATMVVALCSDDASFVTGVPMPVDGGYVAR